MKKGVSVVILVSFFLVLGLSIFSFAQFEGEIRAEPERWDLVALDLVATIIGFFITLVSLMLLLHGFPFKRHGKKFVRVERPRGNRELLERSAPPYNKDRLAVIAIVGIIHTGLLAGIGFAFDIMWLLSAVMCDVVVFYKNFHELWYRVFISVKRRKEPQRAEKPDPQSGGFRQQ